MSDQAVVMGSFLDIEPSADALDDLRSLGIADADITVIHPGQKWTVTPGNYASKGRNCPHAGRELTGRAEMVVVQGEVHRVA